MTPPEEQHGYPDWQRVEQRQLEPLLRKENLEVGAGTEKQFGPFYVGTTPAVTVFAEMTAQEIDTNELWLVWAFDQEGNNPTLVEKFGFAILGNWMYQQVACQAPWLFVTFRTPKLAHLNKYTIIVEPNTSILPEPRRGDPVMLHGSGEVKAGATTIYEIPRVAGGMGTFKFRMGEAANRFFIFFERFKEEGWREMWVWDTGTTASYIHEELALPPQPIRFRVNNILGAGAFHEISLIFP